MSNILTNEKDLVARRKQREGVCQDLGWQEQVMQIGKEERRQRRAVREGGGERGRKAGRQKGKEQSIREKKLGADETLALPVN